MSYIIDVHSGSCHFVGQLTLQLLMERWKDGKGNKTKVNWNVPKGKSLCESIDDDFCCLTITQVCSVPLPTLHHIV